MIVQLAATCGPADWRLVVVSDSPAAWLGAERLPHVSSVSVRPRIFGSGDLAELADEIDPDDGRHVVIATDLADVLSSRTAPLRRLIATGQSIAVLAVCETADDVPAIATSALITHRSGTARWTADTRADALAEPVRPAGISVGRAHHAFAALAGLVDPECAAGMSAIPQRVDLLELLQLHDSDRGDRGDRTLAHRIAACWAQNGSDPAPTAPIGVAADGVIEVDLVADGPHGVLAGTTGAGKSELLRSLVLGLATRLSPNDISFVLVDFKGGSTFDVCTDLPHVVGLVTDLDERLASRALRSLDAELRRRERILRDAGANDLSDVPVGECSTAALGSSS